MWLKSDYKLQDGGENGGCARKVTAIGLIIIIIIIIIIYYYYYKQLIYAQQKSTIIGESEARFSRS